jgi:hypothetical protein
MRNLMLAASMGAIGLATIAAPLMADDARQSTAFETKIRITNYIADMGGSSFLGKVGSANPNCKPDRKGKIFAKGPGDDSMVGKGTTDNQGRFSVPFDPPMAGKFYAKVGKDQIPAGTCKGDRSPIFELN